MRASRWIAVVPCALLAVACKGPPGPQGPQGPQGLPGTVSGTTESPVTLNGGAIISGGTAINGSLAINGTDLFAASMAGLAPAVFGYPYGFGMGHLSCGAPASLDVSTNVSIGNAAYGEIIYTTQGAFNLSQGDAGPGVATCSNVCVGPLTFFLVSPSAQTIQLKGYLDNGPSNIYVNGAVKAAVAGTFTQGVEVPMGPFALSLVSCSTDGFSVGFNLTTHWITAHNLAIDVDRTFHRNGK